jgi:hypothetical protein
VVEYVHMYSFLQLVEYVHMYSFLQLVEYTIYAAKFEQTIIHQHVHLRRESQSHAPAHVLMRLYSIDKSLVCLQSERRKYQEKTTDLWQVDWQTLLQNDVSSTPRYEPGSPLCIVYVPNQKSVLRVSILPLSTISIFCLGFCKHEGKHIGFFVSSIRKRSEFKKR